MSHGQPRLPEGSRREWRKPETDKTTTLCVCECKPAAQDRQTVFREVEDGT